MSKFWKFVMAKAGKVGELYLYGVISSESWYGDEVTPKQFRADLDALGNIETLNVYINSVGGDVWAGQAIHSILARFQGQKNVHIDGIAASIATVIAMAGDRIYMPKNALFMIHKGWMYAAGNADDLRESAALLDKVDETICAMYAKKTGKDDAEIMKLMAAETWMSADEAAEHGFVDEITDEIKAAACIRGSSIVYPDGTEQDAGKFAALLAKKLPAADLDAGDPAGDQQKPSKPETPAYIAAIYEKAHEISMRRMKHL